MKIRTFGMGWERSYKSSIGVRGSFPLGLPPLAAGASSATGAAAAVVLASSSDMFGFGFFFTLCLLVTHTMLDKQFSQCLYLASSFIFWGVVLSIVRGRGVFRRPCSSLGCFLGGRDGVSKNAKSTPPPTKDDHTKKRVCGAPQSRANNHGELSVVRQRRRDVTTPIHLRDLSLSTGENQKEESSDLSLQTNNNNTR